MPKNYGTPFTRYTIGGTLFTSERWALTLNVIGDTPTPSVPTTAQVDAVAAAFKTHVLGINGGVSSRVGIDMVKAARIGADGLYMDPKPVLRSTTVTGGTGTGPYPPQVSLAVTLLGPNPRGAAGRGRVYLPGPAAAMQADGRISANDASNVANTFAAFINAMNDAVDGNVAIVGAATDTGRGPARQSVTGVRVGRVLDTIRSRRSSFPEEPVTATTALTGTFVGVGGA